MDDFSCGDNILGGHAFLWDKRQNFLSYVSFVIKNIDEISGITHREFSVSL